MSDLYGVERLPLLRASEMAEIERRAREEHGMPERLLMENAGRAIAAVVQQLLPEGRVVGAVGSGQVGGGTQIALRTLRSWGREVLAVQAAERPPDPALAHRWDIPIAPRNGAEAAFASAAVILDGVLGTGSTGAGVIATTLVQVWKGDMNSPSDYLEDINDVDAGWKHSLALDVVGHVWAWGDDEQARVGCSIDMDFT